MRQDRKTSPQEAFEAFYSSIYGERWPALRASLLVEKGTEAYSEGLVKEYYMDQASVLTARALPLAEGYRVLDMCAAPGGKTLVLASRLGAKGEIVANDRSSGRKARLDRVLDEHLPEPVRSCVRTTCRDASRWGLYEKEAYDAILLDAPCSSERHVIQSEEHLSIWSPNRPKRLAIEQYSLLSSAFMAAKSGGFILYSTCSINPSEDEGVIARLFKKKTGLVEKIDTGGAGEKREYGRIVLPDVSGGLGPMYYCLLRKL